MNTAVERVMTHRAAASTRSSTAYDKFGCEVSCLSWMDEKVKS